MDGFFLVVLILVGSQGIGTQRDCPAAPGLEPGFVFGFEDGGGDLVVGERGIL